MLRNLLAYSPAIFVNTSPTQGYIDYSPDPYPGILKIHVPRAALRLPHRLPSQHTHGHPEVSIGIDSRAGFMHDPTGTQGRVSEMIVVDFFKYVLK